MTTNIDTNVQGKAIMDNASSDDPIPNNDQTMRKAVNNLAELAAGLGENIANVHGTVADAQSMSNASAEDASSISERIAEMTESNLSIARLCSERADAAKISANNMKKSKEQCESAIGSIESLANVVTALSEKINVIQAQLKEVEAASQEIKGIVGKTHMLSLNASIEANRAGQHGLGFAVVAKEVKDLASQSAKSNEHITQTVATLEKQLSQLIEGYHEARAMAADAGDGTQVVADAMADAVNAIDESVHSVEAIASAAEENQSICAEVDERAKAAASQANTISNEMQRSVSNLDSLLDASENMMQVTANVGIKTDDTRFIEFSKSLADQCSKVLSDAVQHGTIGVHQLFDRRYRAVEKTNPEQFLLEFCTLSDRLVQPILDGALKLDERITFCCEIDENGFIATHNSKVSKPQRDDPVWNVANCRNRRFFKDRAGLKAGQNTKPWQLQTYRRDLGGGNFMIMREANAPIMVNGRIWANIRLGYKLK